MGTDFNFDFNSTSFGKIDNDLLSQLKNVLETEVEKVKNKVVADSDVSLPNAQAAQAPESAPAPAEPNIGRGGSYSSLV